jgi:hypothetical protein
MSLARDILTMSKSDQMQAIHVLATKCKSRKEFRNTIRPLLHAHYNGGATKEESKNLQREWLRVYHTSKDGTESADTTLKEKHMTKTIAQAKKLKKVTDADVNNLAFTYPDEDDLALENQPDTVVLDLEKIRESEE